MTALPKDPVILLSVVNTELRDRFPTLERFAAAHIRRNRRSETGWSRSVTGMIRRRISLSEESLIWL